MANPQPTDAHLRVAHSINEAIMMRDFTKRQRKILDLILRLSWGCNKKDALIPRQRDFQAVGIGEGHIKVELIWLAQSHIITIDGAKYSFNKDFDQWQVSRVRPFIPERLTELVSLNLNSNRPKLTKTVSSNLPKQEVTTYQNGKSPTPELVSPKERLKKVLNKDKYISYPEYPNVNKMTKEEHQKLIEKFGVEGTRDRVENLSLYIASKGDKYKNHYATILAWEKKDSKQLGKNAGVNRINSDDPDKYVKGKFGHMVRR